MPILFVSIKLNRLHVPKVMHQCYALIDQPYKSSYKSSICTCILAVPPMGATEGGTGGTASLNQSKQSLTLYLFVPRICKKRKTCKHNSDASGRSPDRSDTKQSFVNALMHYKELKNTAYKLDNTLQIYNKTKK